MPTIRLTSNHQIYLLRPNSVFVVGRDPRADIPVLDSSCSRNQFSIEINASSECVLRPHSQTCPTYCDGQAVSTPTCLERDVEIRAGGLCLMFSLDDVLDAKSINADCDQHLDKTKAPASRVSNLAIDTRNVNAPMPAEIPTVVAGSSLFENEHQLERIPPFKIVNQVIIGRDPRKANLVLPHVQVSRTHARILMHGDRAFLEDQKSTGGTFLNGRRWDVAGRINNGDVIGIGPYLLHYESGILTPSTREKNLQLVARGLSKTVPDNSKGGRKRILNNVSFVIQSREFVCLIGPAGCGKSTLLSALCGRNRADSGTVALNQVDLYSAYDQLKRDLAVVPQRDLLYSKLSVEESLRFTARLRLPEDTRDDELEGVVDATLKQVGLTPQRSTRIEHLSGGQTKRAALATELLSNPNVIFLDEVTSGLDQQSDREAMTLFRSLAEEGKTVICITHNLTSVERACHMVVVMAEGGHLVYFGPPQKALVYFQVNQIGEIYDKLRTRSPEQWQRLFEASQDFSKYVKSRLVLADHPTPSLPSSNEPKRKISYIAMLSFLHQTRILLSRYCRILISDKVAITAIAGQCFLVSALIILVFEDLSSASAAASPVALQEQATNYSNLLFLAVISCFWFGCNNTSKEFVKEREIFRKEYHAGTRIDAYFFSKLVPLSLISP